MGKSPCKTTYNMAKIYIIMRGRRIVSTHASFIDAIETKTLLNKELGNFYRIEEAKFAPIWKQTTNIQ